MKHCLLKLTLKSMYVFYYVHDSESNDNTDWLAYAWFTYFCHVWNMLDHLINFYWPLHNYAVVVFKKRFRFFRVFYLSSVQNQSLSIPVYFCTRENVSTILKFAKHWTACESKGNIKQQNDQNWFSFGTRWHFSLKVKWSLIIFKYLFLSFFSSFNMAVKQELSTGSSLSPHFHCMCC